MVARLVLILVWKTGIFVVVLKAAWKAVESVAMTACLKVVSMVVHSVVESVQLLVAKQDARMAEQLVQNSADSTVV